MKECPHCGEMIQDGAVKCKYCREFLSANLPEEPIVLGSTVVPPQDAELPETKQTNPVDLESQIAKCPQCGEPVDKHAWGGKRCWKCKLEFETGTRGFRNIAEPTKPNDSEPKPTPWLKSGAGYLSIAGYALVVLGILAWSLTTDPSTTVALIIVGAVVGSIKFLIGLRQKRKLEAEPQNTRESMPKSPEAHLSKRKRSSLVDRIF